MLRIAQCKLPIQTSDTDIKNYLCKRLKIQQNQLLSYRINRKSLDARKKDDIYYVYTFDVYTNNEQAILKKNKDKNISSATAYTYQ